MTDADGASSTNSFVLTILAVNDLPTITTIPDQVTSEDVVLGPINFTIGDVETVATSLSVSGASSNPSLIPNANIVFGGSGSNRTVTITPATKQSGTASITVTVSDGLATTNDVFLVTLIAVNELPTISDITDRAIDEDTSTGPIAFTVGDLETPAGSLTLRAVSSNPSLVPDANVLFGGSGSNRTVTIIPATNQFGAVTMTIFVTDTDGGSTNDTFTLTINPVNDPPTLDPIADRTISENAPQQTVLLFGISSGATNEAQPLTVTATSSKPSIIPNPQVNYVSANTNGSLIFTPLPNTNGTVTSFDFGMDHPEDADVVLGNQNLFCLNFNVGTPSASSMLKTAYRRCAATLARTRRRTSSATGGSTASAIGELRFVLRLRGGGIHRGRRVVRLKKSMPCLPRQIKNDSG